MRGPIARATGRTSTVFAVRLVIQMATLLIVARMLGPHDFGAFTAIAALALILGAFSTFGSQLVLLGETARDPLKQGEILRHAVPTTLAGGVAMLALYLVLAPLLTGEAAIDLHVLVAIGITETVLQPLFSLPATQHLALGRIARSQLLTLIPLALRLFAAAAVWKLAPDAPLAFYSYGYLIASLLALSVATATMPVSWPSPSHMRLPKHTELRTMGGYASLAVSATAPSELDKSLAASLMPMEAAGTYSAAGRIVGAATLPVTAMLLSAAPRLFQASAADSFGSHRLHHWLFGAAAIYSSLMAATLWVLAPLVDGLFGSPYRGIGDTLRLLTLVVPALALRSTACNILMTMGRPLVRVSVECVGLGILTISAILLTASYGTDGMPLALVIAESSMAAIGVILVMLCRTQVNHNIKD
jgi:O-antigen/teichoic acid export membrane protein